MQKIFFFVISYVVVCTGVYIIEGECPQNEEYLLCGSACAFNCTNPWGPSVCTEDCVEGCFCKPGYLRNDSGICVDADECIGNETVCGPNEEFLPCHEACPRTCPQPEPQVCGESCSKGCFCKPGYFRDTLSKECVTLENCPIEQCLLKNEVFDICKGACQPSCANKNPICSKKCKAGCTCALGFFRNKNGECVSADKCLNQVTRETKNQTDNNTFEKYINAIKTLLHM